MLALTLTQRGCEESLFNEFVLKSSPECVPHARIFEWLAMYDASRRFVNFDANTSIQRYW